MTAPPPLPPHPESSTASLLYVFCIHYSHFAIWCDLHFYIGKLHVFLSLSSSLVSCHCHIHFACRTRLDLEVISQLSAGEILIETTRRRGWKTDSSLTPLCCTLRANGRRLWCQPYPKRGESCQRHVTGHLGKLSLMRSNISNLL